MSKVFFTADQHFGHRAICKYRTEFTSAQEHDAYLVESWNKVVTKHKYIVWVLGDFCIQNKTYDFAKLISSLNGEIRVVTGNHDYLPAYVHDKIQVMNGVCKKYDFWLSHCPVHPNEIRGKKNLHGHIHGAHNQLNDSRYINVNCEFWGYKPVDLDYLRSETSNEKA